MINEGPNDPNIFKVIFMSGIPGAGKTTVSDSIQRGTGLKKVDYDKIYEYFSKNKNIDYDKTSDLLTNMMSQYINGRLGLIIDKTSQNYDQILKLKTFLEKIGYQTAMVFVNTDIDLAKQRVLDRQKKTGRKVDKEYIDLVFNKLLNNIGKFQKDFGENFYIVDNTRKFSELSTQKRINKFLNKPLNHIANKWIKNYSYKDNTSRPIEEDYPKGFSMGEFQKISSFSGKKRYADEHLKRISSGSARIVYQIDDKKVLKLAKNKKGLAQNSIESDWGIQQYGIAAKIYDFDDKNTFPFWVEMELTIPLNRKKKRFEQLIGATEEEFWMYLKDVNSRQTEKGWFSAPKELKEKMEENEWVQDIVMLAIDYGMPVPGDLARRSSYGEVKRNGKSVAVLIDFGLTQGVYTEYYS